MHLLCGLQLAAVPRNGSHVKHIYEILYLRVKETCRTVELLSSVGFCVLVQSLLLCLVILTTPKQFSSSTLGGSLREFVKKFWPRLSRCAPRSTLFSVRKIRKTITLNDTNQVRKEEWDYDFFALLTGISPNCGCIDNVIEHREFDYGSGPPGLLLRKTDTK